MATNTPIYPQSFNINGKTIANSDGTNKVTIFTAGTNGSKLSSVLITNTDTAAYTVNIYITISATDYLLGTINVPLSSGNTTSAPTINLLASTGNFGVAVLTDSTGSSYLYIPASGLIKCASTGTVTSGKVITFVAIGEDF